MAQQTVSVSNAQERARAGRRDSGAARRQQLIDAAAECFDEFGYAAVTVEMIAGRAQTSRPTFYAYFGSKDEIFLALVERVSEDLSETQSLDGLDDATPRQILAATTRAYVEAIATMGGLVALIDVTAATDPAVAEIWNAGSARRTGGYARYLRNLPDGVIEPTLDPQRLVEIIGYAIHHGAKRAVGDGAAHKEQFILDIIAVTERLLGVRDGAD